MKKWLSLTLWICALLITVSSKAQGHNVRVRTGMITGSLGGPLATSFSVAPVWNAEYEIPTSLKKSRFFNAILAHDMATAQTKYFGMAYGQRSYVWGTTSYNLMTSDATSKGDYFKMESPHRYFWDWSAGIGQVQTYQATLSLNLTATALDFGGGLGYEYQLFQSTAFTSKLQLGYAYGISSVAVSGMIIQLLFGATMQF